MTSYMISIEVKKGEVGEILRELTEAQEKISECYNRLIDLGVVTLRDETASGD